MRTHRDQVIILKFKNYSEADKILTVFGREFGKFSLLAKGVRRLTSKNRGNIQTLSIADISFYKAQGIPLLLETNADYIPDFTNFDVKNSERVLHLVSKLIPEEQKYPKVFDALKSAIKKGLDDEYTSRFRMMLLMEEGLMDGLRSCNECGGMTEKRYIQLSNFVLLCENCYINKGLVEKDFMVVDKGLYEDARFVSALDQYIYNLLLNIL